MEASRCNTITYSFFLPLSVPQKISFKKETLTQNRDLGGAFPQESDKPSGCMREILNGCESVRSNH